MAADAAEAPYGCIADACLGALLTDLLRIGHQIDETERVERLEAGITLIEALGVKEVAQSRVDAEPEVVSAARTDPQVLLELFVVDQLAAARATRPEVRARRLGTGPEGQSDGHYGSPPGARTRSRASRDAAHQ